MLAVVSPLGNLNDGHEGNTKLQSAELEAFTIIGDVEFPDSSSGNLLESFDFDDLFNDSDALPDLEMDPDILAEFSLSSGEEYCSDLNTTSVEKTAADSDGQTLGINSGIGLGLVPGSSTSSITWQDDHEIVSNKNPDLAAGTTNEKLLSKKYVNYNRRAKATHKSNNKPSGVSSKGASKKGSLVGNRKVKVDWKPELHRQFVQAVEQLGVDKAVPSRILEIMGNDCLTRHNIASHLQKYRSHRKHLLARKAEAAGWSQWRHAYAGGVTATRAVLGKRDQGSPWVVPIQTIRYPPVTSPTQQHTTLQAPGHHMRPLHVWGHPPVDQSLRPLWPKHSPSHTMQPSPTYPIMPQQDSSPFWHNPQTRPQRGIQSGLCQRKPCFSPPLGTVRFPAQAIQGFPPHAMCQVEAGEVGAPTRQFGSQPHLNFHPSEESLDAAIGDVLSKPWLPLPIGLKPPELDSVIGELQRNGIPYIPPACA